MEGIQVFTETECGMCGEIDRREGAEGTIPPVGWAEITLIFRHEGNGWENNTLYNKYLCPTCANEVKGVTALSYKRLQRKVTRMARGIAENRQGS